MTLLTADPKQFQLKEDAQIYFQSDVTNPLPGVPIAHLVKGDGYLTPGIEWRDDAPLDGVDLLAATDKIVTWFGLYVAKVLGPLVTLTAESESLPEPVRTICVRVYDGLGIVPRADLLDAIEKLDPDMRKTLRTRHVRLGPVLAFVPDLTKPAAVRLRATLWSLFHDKPLPAPVPKDGAVSAIIDPATADPLFYQAIGYPLYANRIIRIDMLDRVMNAVYENVKDNQFQAKHQMAEWLGCSIPDLYLVLESMGHKKLHDPADQVKPDAAGADVLAGVVPAVDAPAPDLAAAKGPELAPIDTAAPLLPAEPGPEANAAKPIPVKPELATFRVWWPRKNNKPHHGAPKFRKEKEQKGPKTPPPFEYLDPAEIAARQAQEEERSRHKKDMRDKNDDGENARAGRGRPAGRPGDRSGGRDQKFGGPGGSGSRKPSKPSRTDKNLRLVSSAAAPASKPEDSPFAVLAGLKFKKD